MDNKNLFILMISFQNGEAVFRSVSPDEMMGEVFLWKSSTITCQTRQTVYLVQSTCFVRQLFHHSPLLNFYIAKKNVIINSYIALLLISRFLKTGTIFLDVVFIFWQVSTWTSLFLRSDPCYVTLISKVNSSSLYTFTRGIYVKNKDNGYNSDSSTCSVTYF